MHVQCLQTCTYSRKQSLQDFKSACPVITLTCTADLPALRRESHKVSACRRLHDTQHAAQQNPTGQLPQCKLITGCRPHYASVRNDSFAGTLVILHLQTDPALTLRPPQSQTPCLWREWTQTGENSGRAWWLALRRIQPPHLASERKAVMKQGPAARRTRGRGTGHIQSPDQRRAAS